MKQIDPSDLIPQAQVPEQYPHLYTDRQWAWAMRNRDRNGLNSAVVVMGERRLFLSKSKFAEWIASRIEGESK